MTKKIKLARIFFLLLVAASIGIQNYLKNISNAKEDLTLSNVEALSYPESMPPPLNDAGYWVWNSFHNDWTWIQRYGLD